MFVELSARAIQVLGATEARLLEQVEIGDEFHATEYILGVAMFSEYEFEYFCGQVSYGSNIDMCYIYTTLKIQH